MRLHRDRASSTALRAAVAELGAATAASTRAREARADEPLDELWAEAGKLGYLGVNLPEEYGGGGAGMYRALHRRWRSSAPPAAGLLMMVVSPAICGTVIARFGTDEQKQRWLPGLADGIVDHGLRHHRARRRLQLATASPPPPAATATTGCSPAARSSSPASTSPTPCSSSAAPRTPTTGTLKPVPVHRAHATAPASSTRPIDMDIVDAGEAVPAVPRRRPAARRRARRRRGRRRCSSCSPGSTRSGS